MRLDGFGMRLDMVGSRAWVLKIALIIRSPGVRHL